MQATSVRSTSMESMRRFRHWPIMTLSSTSATFSQLPCLGVYTNSKRSRSALAWAGGKASWSAPGRWVLRSSMTSVILPTSAWRAAMSARKCAQSILVLRSVTLVMRSPASGSVAMKTLQRPAALVLVVVARRLSGTCRERRARLADQLPGRLVHAHHRQGRIVRTPVDVEDPLHRRREVRVALRGNHPADPPPRLDFVFRTRRTVSCDTLSM